MSKDIRAVRVQSCQSTDLAFNQAGVIGLQNFNFQNFSGPAFVGSKIDNGFDLQTEVYSKLANLATENGRDEFLYYNSGRIASLFSDRYLFVLRNEALAASLDQAIAQRASAYQDRFRHSYGLQNFALDFSRKAIVQIKLQIDTMEQRAKAVETFLANNEDFPAVGNSVATTSSFPIMTASSLLNSTRTQPEPGSTVVVKQDNGTVIQNQVTERWSATFPLVFSGGSWNQPDPQSATGFKTQATSTNIVSTPSYDSQINLQQSLAALNKELVQLESFCQRATTMSGALDNERLALDQGIRALQISYAHTFLTSPISGTVTAVYKDRGESVDAGEAILRVENDSYILFVGRIHRRKALKVNDKFKFVLRSIFEDDQLHDRFEATVRSIRGHNSDNDEWEIIASALNQGIDNNTKLPMNYNLDPDTDSLDF